ncbi:tetratricopeptide repeat protein [Silvibacterium sp.]|uniref:tetratricopeptide repeat protein n=1 Tax=Silvibacterium sp. TaxID=1964179 RepID=UPI0039E4864E
MFRPRTLVLAAALVTTTIAAHALSATTTGEAQDALNRGQADRALSILNDDLQQNPTDALALNLRCRVYYAEERWDEAIGDCAQAVRLSPQNSNFHLWLGRAYGEKASRVNFVTAYKIAKLTREEFEAAASLDPHNGEALSDVGQFYIEAPAVLGGGASKAQAVAQQLQAYAPIRAHELLARIAEQKKDYGTAEQEFRQRVTLAADLTPADAAQTWMDLGSFYRRRAQWDQMESALLSGASKATDHGPALVDGASTLIETKRHPELATQWMQQYLSGSSLSEDAPAFVVLDKLGSLYRSQGDTVQAEKSYTAARALATGFTGTRQESKKVQSGR